MQGFLWGNTIYWCRLGSKNWESGQNVSVETFRETFGLYFKELYDTKDVMDILKMMTDPKIKLYQKNETKDITEEELN